MAKDRVHKYDETSDDVVESSHEVIGWFLPRHHPVEWTGLLVDQGTGELVPDPAAVSMTKQSFKDECDINNIVKRFEATGIIDHINQAHAKGLYTDLPEALDLQTGLNMIAQAEAAFMALPAAARSEFDNDPVKFVEAFHNPTEAQQERFIALGLAKDTRPPKAPEAPPVPPVPAPKS